MYDQIGFIAFYTQETFWAGDSPNLNAFPSEGFCNSLKKIFYSEVNDDFHILIHKDGMIKFLFKNICKIPPMFNPPDKQISILNSKLSHINAFVLLLTTEIKNKNISSSNFKNITKRDIFFTNGSMVKTTKFSSGYSWERAKTRDLYTYNPKELIVWDGRFDPSSKERKLSEEIFSTTIQNYKKIYSNDEAINFLADIQKALALFDNGDYGNCLTLLWAHLEIHCKELYREYFGLDNPRSSISKIINELKSSEKISNEVYKTIDRLREVRNRIIHHDTNRDISYKDCLELFNLIFSIANEKYKIGLDFDLPVLI